MHRMMPFMVGLGLMGSLAAGVGAQSAPDVPRGTSHLRHPIASPHRRITSAEVRLFMHTCLTYFDDAEGMAQVMQRWKATPTPSSAHSVDTHTDRAWVMYDRHQDAYRIHIKPNRCYLSTNRTDLVLAHADAQSLLLFQAGEDIHATVDPAPHEHAYWHQRGALVDVYRWHVMGEDAHFRFLVIRDPQVDDRHVRVMLTMERSAPPTERHAPLGVSPAVRKALEKAPPSA